MKVHNQQQKGPAQDALVRQQLPEVQQAGAEPKDKITPQPKEKVVLPGLLQLPSNVIRQEGAAKFEQAVQQKTDGLGIHDDVMALPDPTDMSAEGPQLIDNPLRGLTGIHARPAIDEQIAQKRAEPQQIRYPHTVQEEGSTMGRPPINEEVRQPLPGPFRIQNPQTVQSVVANTGRPAIADELQQQPSGPHRIMNHQVLQPVDGSAHQRPPIGETVQRVLGEMHRIMNPNILSSDQDAETADKPKIDDPIKQAPTGQRGRITDELSQVRQGPFQVRDPRIQEKK